MQADRPAFMIQSAFARHRGVNPSTVFRWVSRGVVSLNAAGLVEVAVADARLDERPDSYRGGLIRKADARVTRKGAGNDFREKPAQELLGAKVADIAEATGWSLQEAQRVKETFLAMLRKLEYEQKSSQLVPLAAVRRHVEKSFIGYRQAIQRLPSRCAPTIAADLGCDPARLEVLLSQAINQMLTELSSPVVRP